MEESKQRINGAPVNEHRGSNKRRCSKSNQNLDWFSNLLKVSRGQIKLMSHMSTAAVSSISWLKRLTRLPFGSFSQLPSWQESPGQVQSSLEWTHISSGLETFGKRCRGRRTSRIHCPACCCMTGWMSGGQSAPSDRPQSVRLSRVTALC